MISVIIPTYNRATYLEKSIQSILRQTYQDFELIIVDDGSTDNTEDVVLKMEDIRIKYLKLEHVGACAARNQGISLAKGEYIAFHDSDDLCRDNRLERQLEILQKTKADVVCCKCMRYQNGKSQEFPKKEEGYLHDYVSLSGLGVNVFLGKAEVFKNIYFDTDMPRWQDLEILMRIQSANYRIYFMNETLLDYYILKDSISNDPQKCFKAFELINLKHPEIKQNNKMLYANLLTWRVREKMRIGDKAVEIDFYNIYKIKKDWKSLLWFLLAKCKVATMVYNIRECRKKGDEK